MVEFFMPDGDGGQRPPEEAENVYSTARRAAEAESFWRGTFTDQRVFAVTSRHNGRDYDQRVGELTSDRLLVLAIFQSFDERGRERFVVQSIRHTVHVDPSKVVSVAYFDEPSTEPEEPTTGESTA